MRAQGKCMSSMRAVPNGISASTRTGVWAASLAIQSHKRVSVSFLAVVEQPDGDAEGGKISRGNADRSLRRVDPGDGVIETAAIEDGRPQFRRALPIGGAKIVKKTDRVARAGRHAQCGDVFAARDRHRWSCGTATFVPFPARADTSHIAGKRGWPRKCRNRTGRQSQRACAWYPWCGRRRENATPGARRNCAVR